MLRAQAAAEAGVGHVASLANKGVGAQLPSGTARLHAEVAELSTNNEMEQKSGRQVGGVVAASSASGGTA